MGQTEKNQQRKDFNHHLGRRIADRRLETGHSAVETGHSAAELDRVLSLNPGSIAAFESGRRSIGAGLLFTLGLVLGVPMEFLSEMPQNCRERCRMACRRQKRSPRQSCLLAPSTKLAMWVCGVISWDL